MEANRQWLQAAADVCLNWIIVAIVQMVLRLVANDSKQPLTWLEESVNNSQPHIADDFSASSLHTFKGLKTGTAVRFLTDGRHSCQLYLAHYRLQDFAIV